MALVPGEFTKAQGGEYGLYLSGMVHRTGLYVLLKAFFQLTVDSSISPVSARLPWSPSHKPTGHQLKQNSKCCWDKGSEAKSPTIPQVHEWAIGFRYSPLAFSMPADALEHLEGDIDSITDKAQGLASILQACSYNHYYLDS